MDAVLDWVKQIAMFYIIANVIIHILPNGNYVKYIKLFVGLILIAVVLGPITGLFNIDQVFNKLYESAVSDSYESELKSELKYAETSSYDQIIKPYREEVVKNVENIIIDNGLYPVTTDVKFNTDSSSDTFGQISSISMVVSQKETESEKVYIDKIKVEVGTQQSKEKLSVQAVNIKTSVADFYNIEVNNINVSEGR